MKIFLREGFALKGGKKRSHRGECYFRKREEGGKIF
jgi:hypothetical protein